MTSVGDYLAKAKRCEANAASADSPKLRQQFSKGAEMWLRLAGGREHSRSEPSGESFAQGPMTGTEIRWADLKGCGSQAGKIGLH